MNSVGDEVTSLHVEAKGGKAELHNATKHGPPDFLLLQVSGVDQKKSPDTPLNATLSYSFQVRNWC